MEWFRWYHGTTDDKKFTVIARKAGVPRATVLAVWSTLVEQASTRQDRGSLDGYDFEEIAACLEIDIEQVERVYKALEEKEVIKAGRLKNWEKRQPKTEDPTATERKRAQREREKLRAEIDELKALLARFEEGCHDVSRSVTKSHDRTEQSRADKRREEKPAKKQRQSGEAGDAPKEPDGKQAGMTPTEKAIRECVKEKRGYLAETFPGVDIELEMEECIAKYRRESIGSDPWLIVIRWFRNLPNDRASPHVPGEAERVTAANRQAAREFCGFTETGAEVVNDGCG